MIHVWGKGLGKISSQKGKDSKFKTPIPICGLRWNCKFSKIKNVSREKIRKIIGGFEKLVSTIRKYERPKKGRNELSGGVNIPYYCTSDYFLPIELPRMHRMIAPYQTKVYPLRLLRGQWPPLWAIATRLWHLTGLVVCYLSCPHTIWTIYQITYTFLIIWTNYLLIICILSFTIYTA